MARILLGGLQNRVKQIHKIKLEHIKLTSYSKMRVDLAAQVSTSMYSCCSCVTIYNDAGP